LTAGGGCSGGGGRSSGVELNKDRMSIKNNKKRERRKIVKRPAGTQIEAERKIAQYRVPNKEETTIPTGGEKNGSRCL